MASATGKSIATTATSSPPRVSKTEFAFKEERVRNEFVEDLLEQMQSKFTKLGDSLIGRMDEMGNRMDELEQSIAALMDEVGLEPPKGSRTTSDEV